MVGKRRKTPRLYVEVFSAERSVFYWPVRRVVSSPGRVTIYYHSRSQVTFDLSTHSIIVETAMWEGPLP